MSNVEAKRLGLGAAVSVVVLAGQARSLPLMIAIAKTPGTVVGCDDTALVRDRKRIVEATQTLSDVRGNVHFAKDQFSRTSEIQPLCGPTFVEGAGICIGTVTPCPAGPGLRVTGTH